MIVKYVEILDQLFEPAYIIDDKQKILFWNKAAEKLTGYDAKSIIGKNCSLSEIVHTNESGEKLCLDQCPFQELLDKGKVSEQNLFLSHKTGYRIPISLRMVPIFNQNKKIIGSIEFFIKRDQITTSARPDVIKELVKTAYIDSITGLPNKEYMESKLLKILNEAKINPLDTQYGLLVIDIHNLQEFNNVGGLEGGDFLLKVLVQTIVNNLEDIADCFVTRWYGGKFIIIINSNKINTLLNWSNKFKTLIEQSIILGYENHKIKVSIAGVIIYPEDTLQSLIRNLEQQLLISKRQNNNISIKEG